MITRDDITGKRFLVTGASGFIGSRLCKRLRALGCEVHGITRAERLSGLNGMQWWCCNLSAPKEVLEVVESVQADVVCHLSGCVTGSRSLDVVLPTFQSNLVSAVNLLSALSKVGCQRFLLAGSMEEPRLDGCHPSAISPYAASKWSSSIYGRMFHALWNLPVVILNVFMVYGPGQSDLSKLIPYVALCLLRNEVPKLTSGSREVDWIYVDDVVEALIASAIVAGIEGKMIDVGSGTVITVRGVVEQLAALINPKVRLGFGALEDRPFEYPRVADTETAWNELGWKSKVQIKEGLRRTARWCREQLFAGAFG